MHGLEVPCEYRFQGAERRIRNAIANFFGRSEKPKNIGTEQFFGGLFSGRTRSHTTRLNSCVNTDKTLL